jgi:hypothetical protein
MDVAHLVLVQCRRSQMESACDWSRHEPRVPFCFGKKNTVKRWFTAHHLARPACRAMIGRRLCQQLVQICPCP